MLRIVEEIPRILGKQNDRLPVGHLGSGVPRELTLPCAVTGLNWEVGQSFHGLGKEALASLCGVCLPARKCELSSVFYRTGLALEISQRSQRVKGTKYVWFLKGLVILCRVTLQNILCPVGSQHCWCFLMLFCWIITGIVCSMYYTATI